MNRKLIGAVAFAAVVAGGYLAHNIQKQSDEQLSDLMIENIEALTQNESQTIPIPCHSSGKYDANKRYTDCSTCTPVIAYKGEGRQALCHPK